MLAHLTFTPKCSILIVLKGILMREIPTPILWERLKTLREKLARLVRSGKRGLLRDWREYNLIARIIMRRRNS